MDPAISPVPFGSKITFTCTSSSHPKVLEYRFYLHRERLGYSTTGVFQHEIRKSGSYSCVPFNDAGKGEKATVVIHVDGKPHFCVYCVCNSCLYFSCDEGARPEFFSMRTMSCLLFPCARRIALYCKLRIPKDGDYFCYCAYVLAISRYSGFL